MFVIDIRMKMFAKTSVTLTNEFQKLEVIWDVEPLRLQVDAKWTRVSALG